MGSGTWPIAWTAAVWTRVPWARAAAASAGKSWTAPVSLFTSAALSTEAREPASAASTPSGRSTPRSSTGISRTSSGSGPAARARAVASTAGWSVAATATAVREGSFARTPSGTARRARLSASVPPEVMISQLRGTSSSSAMRESASSSTPLARRPAVWTEEGFPQACEASRKASRAAGRSTVVAAWSR